MFHLDVFFPKGQINIGLHDGVAPNKRHVSISLLIAWFTDAYMCHPDSMWDVYILNGQST